MDIFDWTNERSVYIMNIQVEIGVHSAFIVVYFGPDLVFSKLRALNKVIFNIRIMSKIVEFNSFSFCLNDLTVIL